MDMFPLELVVLFILSRANCTYHPHLRFKKYMVLRNPALARILISQQDPVSSSAKIPKANRNKILCAGIVFYGLLAALVVLYVVLMCVPEIPCPPFLYASKAIMLSGNTLNEKLPAALSLGLLFAEGAFFFINTLSYGVEKTRAKKTVRFLYLTFAVLWTVGVLVCLWVAVSSIIAAV